VAGNRNRSPAVALGNLPCVTLAGIDRLLNAPDDDRQRVMNNLCRSLQPPADTGNLPVLPGAPK